jgi:hypothetical protein
MIPHHVDTELMADTDWVIDGTLLDVNGQALDLSNATLQWTLCGPDGSVVLTEADASINIVPPPTGGIITISIARAKSASFEAGRYIDALEVTIGDVVSPLWIGNILVAANPRRIFAP